MTVLLEWFTVLVEYLGLFNRIKAGVLAVFVIFIYVVVIKWLSCFDEDNDCKYSMATL